MLLRVFVSAVVFDWGTREVGDKGEGTRKVGNEDESTRQVGGIGARDRMNAGAIVLSDSTLLHLLTHSLTHSVDHYPRSHLHRST